MVSELGFKKQRRPSNILPLKKKNPANFKRGWTKLYQENINKQTNKKVAGYFNM